MYIVTLKDNYILESKKLSKDSFGNIHFDGVFLPFEWIKRIEYRNETLSKIFSWFCIVYLIGCCSYFGYQLIILMIKRGDL